MPISSGASGRPSSARSHLPAGGQTATSRNDDSNRPVSTRITLRRDSVSSQALDQENKRRVCTADSNGRVSEIRARSKQMPVDRTNSSSNLRNSSTISEKPKRIGNGSNSTKSPQANFVRQDFSNRQIDSDGDKQRNRRNSPSEHPHQLPDDAQRDQALVVERSEAEANNSAGNKWPGLFSSLMSLDASREALRHEGEDKRRGQTNRTTTMKRSTAGQGGRPSLGDAHYSTTTTINETSGSINPSMSPAFHIGGKKLAGSNSTRTPASSTNSSTANLHSLSSLHQQPSTTTTINRGFNLKYVKTLIIVLMSLDFLITIFVHNFASHDEFLIAFTRSKLRLSLVNLIASAVWFVVLSGAILFDVYFVLVIACLVDLASFIILLACSVFHFTHRVDYNLVSMTSLLLVLFSIIILHVYLLALTALTIYLTLAVKRRKL